MHFFLVATSKSGGGTQGREVKTKAVKSKFKGRGAAHDDEDVASAYPSHGPKVCLFSGCVYIEST